MKRLAIATTTALMIGQFFAPQANAEPSSFYSLETVDSVEYLYVREEHPLLDDSGTISEGLTSCQECRATIGDHYDESRDKNDPGWQAYMFTCTIHCASEGLDRKIKDSFRTLEAEFGGLP